MGRTKNIPADIEEKIIYNYLELKQGLGTAGKEYKVSQYMVEKILKKYGIKKRTYTEAKQQGRKYSCNDAYFKHQNKDMAYILGLLASDGSVSVKENLIAIQLLDKDKEILEKIKKETEVSRPLEEYIRKETGHKIISFRNWSKIWKQDLAHFGIVPKKTFKLQPPIFLDPKFKIDYIRGYFDGDGSVYSLNKKNRVFIEITGASKPLIDWIHETLVNDYHIIVNKPITETLSNGTIMYKIKIGNKNEILKLYNLFYNKTNFYISRKKEKMETLLNIPRDFNSSN